MLRYSSGGFFRELFSLPFEGKEFMRQCFAIGYKSLPLVGITGFIMGLVLTIQSRPTLAEFGAESWLPGMVALSLIREIAPVITAQFCAGKIASGIAQLAELTYKMNNGNGLLSKVMDDDAFGKSLETTLTNLQSSSEQFSKFAVMMNNGKGAMATLMTDQAQASNIKQTVANLQASSDESVLFSAKMNSGKGALSRLVTDEKVSNTLNMTLINLQGAT